MENMVEIIDPLQKALENLAFSYVETDRKIEKAIVILEAAVKNLEDLQLMQTTGSAIVKFQLEEVLKELKEI